MWKSAVTTISTCHFKNEKVSKSHLVNRLWSWSSIYLQKTCTKTIWIPCLSFIKNSCTSERQSNQSNKRSQIHNSCGNTIRLYRSIRAEHLRIRSYSRTRMTTQVESSSWLDLRENHNQGKESQENSDSSTVLSYKRTYDYKFSTRWRIKLSNWLIQSMSTDLREIQSEKRMNDEKIIRRKVKYSLGREGSARIQWCQNCLRPTDETEIDCQAIQGYVQERTIQSSIRTIVRSWNSNRRICFNQSTSFSSVSITVRRANKADSGTSQKRIDKDFWKRMRIISSIRSKTKRQMTNVCRLSILERSHKKKHISSSTNRWKRKSDWISQVILKVRSSFRILASKSTPRRHLQDGIQYKRRQIWVHDNVLRPY